MPIRMYRWYAICDWLVILFRDEELEVHVRTRQWDTQMTEAPVRITRWPTAIQFNHRNALTE